RRPTSSTCTSPACARRSTRASTARCCRPCAGPATAWMPSAEIASEASAAEAPSVASRYLPLRGGTRVRMPRIFRTTPFRLTVLFLTLFAAAALALFAYIYVATAGEATRRTEQDISREMHSLVAAYDRAGVDAVNQSLIERAASERPFLYLLMDQDGK